MICITYSGRHVWCVKKPRDRMMRLLTQGGHYTGCQGIKSKVSTKQNCYLIKGHVFLLLLLLIEVITQSLCVTYFKNGFGGQISLRTSVLNLLLENHGSLAH
jgi:hypothetical protein